jgi:hypothetical protein
LCSAKFEVSPEPKLSQRTKEQAFPAFVLETVEGTVWQSDDPFEDPEGFPALPNALSPDGIEWKRPSELSLGELPIWHKLREEEVMITMTWRTYQDQSYNSSRNALLYA